MIKASLFASAAVATLIGASMAAPVLAQGTGGPFADVPVDHWAYKAVDTLQKDGIVIGYPDGTYGGKHAMTRYEFAVAIARLLEKIPTPVDMSKYVTTDQLNTALAPYALKTDIPSIAGLAKQSDVDLLKSMLDEFKTELTTLGVDVDASKKRLDAIEARLSKDEADIAELKKAVKISGSTSIYARGAYGTNGEQIIDQDGYVEGTYTKSGAQATPGTAHGSLFYDSSVLFDSDLVVKGHVTDTITATADINYGNLLGYNGQNLGGGGTSPGLGRTTGDSAESTAAFDVYQAEIDSPVRLGRLGGADVSVGRMPLQFTEYTFKQVDPNSYFYNYKTSLGDIPVDGAKAKFNFGSVGITAVAGKIAPITDFSDGETFGLYAGATTPNVGATPSTLGLRTRGLIYGSTVDPSVNGAMTVQDLGGVRAVIGDSHKFQLGGTYLVLGGTKGYGLTTETGAANDGTNSDIDRVYVYGGDLAFRVASVGLKGSYTKSDTSGESLNSDGTLDTDRNTKLTGNDEAWDTSATIGKKLALTGGYKEIAPYFAAPGEWDHLGSWKNPTDIKGPYVSAKFGLFKALTVSGEAKFYQGTGTAKNDGGLLETDKINNYRIGLDFNLNRASRITFGMEETQYHAGVSEVTDSGLALGGSPIQYYYDLGYGYTFSPAAMFKIQYEIVDYHDNGSGFASTTEAGGENFSTQGGIVSTQFTVKF